MSAQADLRAPQSRLGSDLGTVTLIDLGYGNLGSIRIAFERLGVRAGTSADPDEIAAADRLVLPGVGAASFAMERLRSLGLTTVIRDYTGPFLGICLGMQLLFDWSEEGGTKCLGVMEGNVRRLAPAPDRPVPHMGWSKLSVYDASYGLADDDYVWFAHSYACEPGPFGFAYARYGGPVPAAVARDNFLGCQFHPERSSDAGARFLKAFVGR